MLFGERVGMGGEIRNGMSEKVNITGSFPWEIGWFEGGGGDLMLGADIFGQRVMFNGNGVRMGRD